MIYVYAILSTQSDWIYVGMTNNLERRLHEHNAGLNQSTKAKKPFTLILSEQCPDRVSARVLEKYYKSAAGKRKIRKLRDGRGPV